MSELVERVGELRELLAREHTQAPGLFGEMARMEGLLADTYRNRVLYELLQNSDDAGARSVEFDAAGTDRFRWSNDGRALDLADIEGLCRSASSTKQRGSGSIGYRGIGFKSLAAVASRIEVGSADVEFTFDRSASMELLGETATGSVPLIRVPTGVRARGRIEGVTFTVTCLPGAAERLGTIDPVSTLFLRNVEYVGFPGDPDRSMRIERGTSEVILHLEGEPAHFGMIRHGGSTVAVPLNPRAMSLTGNRGRMACFLPLEDEVGLPVIVSGDLLTDPSRTHAVVRDESTQRVLADAAKGIADCLRSPGSPLFEQVWRLLLSGEDARNLLIAPHTTVAKTLLTALREEMSAHGPTFTYSSLPLEPEDVKLIFPDGAPASLYEEGNRTSAKAVKSLLGLGTLDFSELLETVQHNRMSETLRGRLGRYLSELARTHGRKLTAGERELVGEPESGSTRPEPTFLTVPENRPVARTDPERSESPSLSEVMARWRTAEVATMEFLNDRGWRLHDVSRQNIGYDLEGTDADGHSVRVEVKKVKHPNDTFSLTNNEMSYMLTAGGGYLIALVIGDGRHVQLAILDPSGKELPKDRVCRRWDWEFTDWMRFTRVVR